MRRVLSWRELFSTQTTAEEIPDPDLPFKLFAVYCVITAVIYFITGLNYLTFGNLRLAALAGLHFAVALVCLWLTKIRWHFRWVAHLRFAYGWLVVFYTSYRLGGMSAPALHWIGFLPFFYYLVLGRTASFFWLAAWIAQVIVIYLTDDSGPLIKNAKAIAVFGTFAATLFSIIFVEAVVQHVRNLILRQHEVSSLLLRMLCHDIRSPIQVIAFVADDLESRSPNLPRDRERMHLALDSLTSLLSHSTKVIYDRATRMPLNKDPVDLETVISELLDFLGPRLASKELSARLEVKAQRPVICVADRERLKWQVLGNILSNAINFSVPGDVVRVRLRRLQNRVSIVIADTGIGIPKETIAHLFDASRKSSRIGTAGESGTGLGLFIARSYLERMGGRIAIRSRVHLSGRRHGTELPPF